MFRANTQNLRDVERLEMLEPGTNQPWRRRRRLGLECEHLGPARQCAMTVRLGGVVVVVKLGADVIQEQEERITAIDIVVAVVVSAGVITAVDGGGRKLMTKTVLVNVRHLANQTIP